MNKNPRKGQAGTATMDQMLASGRAFPKQQTRGTAFRASQEVLSASGRDKVSHEQ